MGAVVEEILRRENLVCSASDDLETFVNEFWNG